MGVRWCLVVLVLAGAACGEEEIPRRRSLSRWPDNPYCDPARAWEVDWVSFEREVLERVNARRGEGASCGGVPYDPAPALLMEEHLRCAARRHAQDMLERGFFDHINPDGENHADRMRHAEYEQPRMSGENIAAGDVTPEEVVEGWMNSPGHCANIMTFEFVHIGVGYLPPAPHWVQVFATPL